MGKREHELRWDDTGMIDIAICSCGWSSVPYFDGAVWARQDWEEHVASSLRARDGGEGL